MRHGSREYDRSQALFPNPGAPSQRPTDTAIRTFVTNDELRTCLSQDALVPWFDGPSSRSVPRPLVAFRGPVAFSTLDKIRPRGPNTFWIGLELDGQRLPVIDSFPAPMDPVLPMRTLRKIVFATADQRARFEAPPMANVRLPARNVDVDEAWFAGTVEADLPDEVLAVASAEEADRAKRFIDRFRRLHGATVSVLGLTSRSTELNSFLLSLIRHRAAPSRDLRAWAGADIANVLSFEGIAADDPAAEAWATAAGIPTTEVTSDLGRLDQHVRAEVVSHLIAASGPVLDRESLIQTIDHAAAKIGQNGRYASAAGRYPRAIEVGKRVWRNKTTWERLLENWPSGFDTLLAVLFLGSVHTADQYEILASRLRELPVPAHVIRLAAVLYGLRWGIESLPTNLRGAEHDRRISEDLVWDIAGRTAEAPPAPIAADWSMKRRDGRGTKRPYLIRLAVPHHHFERNVEPIVVMTSRLEEASRQNPSALKRLLLPLAATHPDARSFLGWEVVIPATEYSVMTKRGCTVLTGTLSNGEPSVKMEWADWDGFVNAATREDGLLRRIKRASDVVKWEQAIQEAGADQEKTS